MDCQRASMAFGRPGHKFAYARQVAAALAYIGMSNLDDGQPRPVTRADLGEAMNSGACAARGKVFDLFEFLEAARARSGETDLRPLLPPSSSRKERRRGVVVLISDLYDLDGVIPVAALPQEPAARDCTSFTSSSLLESASHRLRGDLRLVDSEDGATSDVTVTDALREALRGGLRAHATPR